jgi:hypothetical protein
MILEDKNKVLADSIFSEGLLHNAWTAIFSLCPHARGVREVSGLSFVRASNHLPKALLLIPSQWVCVWGGWK